MKKLKLVLIMLVTFISNNYSQQISILKEDKISAWKQGKLYGVKTIDDAVNKVFESSLKTTFQNYAGMVSLEETEKLMDNENNFLAIIYYPGVFKQKKIDHIDCGIGILQASQKKLKIVDAQFYRSMLVYQDYIPVAPNLTISFAAKEAGDMYNKDGYAKTFVPEPNIIAMIPSTLLNFKQYIDVIDKTVDIKGIKNDRQWMYALSRNLSVDAKILKNKTLLILNNPLTEDFYNAYTFKKERVEKNDLSKVSSKDKGYCFLKYTYLLGDLMQVSVIDCETGLLIYTDNTYSGNTNIKPMSKEMAVDLNNAVNGKLKEKK